MNRWMLTISASVLTSGITFAQGQFPLHGGNIWQFTDADPMSPAVIESKVVGDTSFPNGMSYTVFEGFGAAPGARYVRQEGTEVFSYSVFDSVESLIYDFAAEVGDTVGPWDFDWITLAEKGSRTFSGRTLTYWTFSFSYFADITLIDSIGPLDMLVEPGTFWNLRGAVINGIQYGIITEVDPFPGGPSGFRLLQNYPNPFNSISDFGFRISDLSEVSLIVYDLLGRQIATVVNERLAPGLYSRRWDAAGLPSGVYYYRMTAGSYVETKKLVLLR